MSDGTGTIPIWDAEQGVAARDEGMARVQVRSAPWAAVAMDALIAVAREHDELTTEDVWKRLDAMRIPRPTEARAMGPVVRRATVEMIVEPAGYSRSSNPACHRGIIRIYRSLVA